MLNKLQFRTCLFLSLILLLAACSGQRVMMPTPNIEVNPEKDHYADLHPELKSTEVPMFYITDRVPERDENGNLEYGYQRSHSVAFGRTVVDLGQDISWEDLVAASRTQKRLKKVPLSRSELLELGRAPDTPMPYIEVDGKIVSDPKVYAARAAAVELFHKGMTRQLALTPRKEIFIEALK